MSTHEHEKWQIRDDGCGDKVTPKPDPLDPERCPKGDPECDTEIGHDGCYEHADWCCALDGGDCCC